MNNEQLQKTPLYNSHLALKAKMVSFGGWDMPVQYEGILAEYDQTRTSVAIFDISHMGEFIIEGDAIDSGLDRLVTMDIVSMPIQSCRYGAMLNDQGGVLDDLIVFRLEEEKWFLVVNAATTVKDAEHLQKHLTSQAKFIDVSAQTGKIDVQGPRSRDVLNGLVEGISRLDYYTFDFFDLLGENVLISRTGYTGELGYEIYYSWDKIETVWNALLKNDLVKPAGLGARDLLRLEVGYSLYGHELSEQRTPLETGLNRFVDFDKDFIGKEVLAQQQTEGVPYKIIGLISETRRAPRSEQLIYNEAGEHIGEITSGGFSPYLQKGIGLGLVKASVTQKGDQIFFGNDKTKNLAEVTKKIFYKNGSLKN